MERVLGKRWEVWEAHVKTFVAAKPASAVVAELERKARESAEAIMRAARVDQRLSGLLHLPPKKDKK